MIEKLAQAIWVATHGEPVGWSPMEQHTANMQALAALKAMREPSDAMALSVGSEWGSALEDNWRTMIDAAISEA